jgi:hypothetical protein
MHLSLRPGSPIDLLALSHTNRQVRIEYRPLALQRFELCVPANSIQTFLRAFVPRAAGRCEAEMEMNIALKAPEQHTSRFDILPLINLLRAAPKVRAKMACEVGGDVGWKHNMHRLDVDEVLGAWTKGDIQGLRMPMEFAWKRDRVGHVSRTARVSEVLVCLPFGEGGPGCSPVIDVVFRDIGVLGEVGGKEMGRKDGESREIEWEESVFHGLWLKGVTEYTWTVNAVLE